MQPIMERTGQVLGHQLIGHGEEELCMMLVLDLLLHDMIPVMMSE